MVALAEWIESEETAVAAPSSRPGEPLPAAENRVWDFFGRTPDRVGEDAPQIADCVWVIELESYDVRRSPSLARSNYVIEAGPSRMERTNVSRGPYGDQQATIQAGRVTINSTLEVKAVGDGTTVLRSFGGSGPLNVAGQTALNVSVVYDGKTATVNLAYSVFINNAHIGGDLKSELGIGIQFGEWQHVNDLRNARSGLVEALNGTLDSLLSSRFPSTNTVIQNNLMITIEGHFRPAIEATIRNFDQEGGPHNGGLLLVPIDFGGF